MSIFNRQKSVEVRTPVPATDATAPDDYATRVGAMNARAAQARTMDDALEVMRESAEISADLFKSFAAQKNGKDEAEPGADEIGDESPADESPTETAKTDATLDSDEGPDENPDDRDLMAGVDAAQKPDEAPAPAAAPEAIAAATGKTDAEKTDDEKPASAPATGKLRKSLAELVEEAQSAGFEVVMDSDSLLEPMLKSFAATQEHQSETAQTLETTNDYLEQLGTLMNKSLEGMAQIGENQRALFERVEQMEASQQSAGETAAQELGELKKSFAPVQQWLQGARQAPLGTPMGRAPLAPNSVPGHALAGEAPSVAPERETYRGFARDELKKSIEAHIRSDRCTETGVTTAHLLSISRTPMEEIDPLIYATAAKELNRTLLDE